jgi:hypothetical protein
VIVEILAVLCGVAGIVTAAISSYALGGWPALGLLTALGLFTAAGLLGIRPDKPL